MKRLKIITALLILSLLAFCAVACNDGVEIEKLEIKSGSIATEITVGDTLDTSNLAFTVYFTDGTTKEITGDDFTVGALDTTTVGEKLLTVTYQGFTATIKINVKAAPVVELDRIEIKSGTVATEVMQGSTLNTANLKVTAYYNDGTTREISATDLTIGSINTVEAGTQTLIVVYQGEIASIDITVSAVEEEVTEVELTKIEIKQGTIATVVEQGEAVDISNLKILAYYEDESIREFFASQLSGDDYSTNYDGLSFDEAGTVTLTVTYKGKSASIDITVERRVEIETIEYVSGIELTVYQYDQIDTSNAVIKAIYTNTTEEILDNQYITFGNIDTTAIGEFDLTITYSRDSVTKSCTVAYEVVVNPNSTLDIIAVKSDLKLEYASNIADKTNKEEQFTNQADGYYVGDDNEFVYKPRAEEASKGYPRSISEELLDMEISLLVMDTDGNFNAVSDLDAYVVINGYGVFDFTDEAVGKTFSLTVTPFVRNFRETTNSRNVSETITFTVIDGWNAYSVADLSMIDNRLESAENDEEAARAKAWNDYKTAKGLPVNFAPDAVIMHSDITVTASDIPLLFFYNEGDEDVKSSDDDVRGVEGYVSPIGSLRDYEDIYNRYVGADKTFAFIGNYFTLNAETVPVVIRENGDLTKAGDVQGHSQLIRFHGDRGVPSDKTIGKVDMKNIYILGNANRTENMLAGGGLISHKARNVDATIQNVIAREWYITFFSEAYGENGVPDLTLYTVKDSKAYDNFNSFVYVWGGQNNTFEDCEMIGAGGPVMIIDHVLGKDNGTEATNDDRPDSPADVKIRNCNLKSIVTGTEGWFQSFEATPLAAALKDLNGLFTQYGKSILVSGNGTITGNIQSDVYFNLVVITKSGSAQGMTFEQIANSIQIDDGQPLDFGTKASEDANSYMLKAHLDGILGFEADLKAVFQSSAGGVAFTDGQTPAPVRFTGMSNPPYAPITDATDSVFDGDYLNTYIGGAGDGYMGAIFGYYDYNVSSAS